MKVSCNIPKRNEITSRGIPLSVAADGESWSSIQLGPSARDSGVYVLYAGNRILYVGQTMVGNYGNYGERFRRHCQKKASRNSKVYQLLRSQNEGVWAYLLGRSDLGDRVRQEGVKVSVERMALLLEQALIGAYEPPGNRK